MVISYTRNDTTVITLQPNQSASREQTRLFFCLVAGTTLLVALFWTFNGAWLVLPFAGLEVAVLAYVMNRVFRDSRHMQVITIAQDAVKLEEGNTHPEKVWHFDREDLYLAVQVPDNPVELMRLRFVSEQGEIPLGSFLNQQDLKLTREALQQAGIVHCSNQWWVR